MANTWGVTPGVAAHHHHTQVLGYGWAGVMRKNVVEPTHMWWPGTLVQVSLFRALHEKEDEPAADGSHRRMSRAKFFLASLACSFLWYAVPGYLFRTLTSVSWLSPRPTVGQSCSHNSHLPERRGI